jgi:tetratricopeptide (TPR) repeat protein
MRAAFALGMVLAGAAFAHPSLAQESLLDGLKSAAFAAPFEPLAALRYGRALRRAGHEKDAAQELRRGIALAAGGQGETGIELRYELAGAQIDQRDFWGAMATCRSMASLPGASSASHACVAEDELLRRLGTEALVETAQALANGTRNYEAKVAEGLSRELEVNDAGAEASFREAIAWAPDAWEAHAWLGRLLVRQLHHDEGVSELRRAVELDPDGPVPAYELARAMPASPEAARLLEKAVRERPTYLLAELRLADVDLELGRLVPAREVADAVIHAHAAEPSAYVVSGRVALAEGRPDEALRAGQQALGLLSNSARAKLLVADAYAAKGEIDFAIEAYQSAYGLDPSDPASLVHASVACHANERDTSARAFAERATHDFPEWGPGWVALGEALAGQGETARARSVYETALHSKGPVDAASVRAKLSTLR